MVERQHVSGDTPLTYEVDLTYGVHPGLHGPVHLLLVRNITFRIHKSFGAMRKGAVLHFQEQTSNPIT